MPEATRCADVPLLEVGSRCTAAATTNAKPATASAARPLARPRSKPNASAKHASATRSIPMTTSAAAGMPGMASLLTVRWRAS